MSFSPGFPSFLSGMAGAGSANGGAPAGGQPQWAGQIFSGAGSQPSMSGGVLAPYVSQIGQLFNNPNPFGQQPQMPHQMPVGQPVQGGWAGQGQQGQTGQAPQFQSGTMPPYLQSLWQMMQGWGQHGQQPQGATGQGAYGNAGFSAYDPFGPQFR